MIYHYNKDQSQIEKFAEVNSTNVVVDLFEVRGIFHLINRRFVIWFSNAIALLERADNYTEYSMIAYQPSQPRLITLDTPFIMLKDKKAFYWISNHASVYKMSLSDTGFSQDDEFPI